MNLTKEEIESGEITDVCEKQQVAMTAWFNKAMEEEDTRCAACLRPKWTPFVNGPLVHFMYVAGTMLTCFCSYWFDFKGKLDLTSGIENGLKTMEHLGTWR